MADKTSNASEATKTGMKKKTKRLSKGQRIHLRRQKQAARNTGTVQK